MRVPLDQVVELRVAPVPREHPADELHQRDALAGYGRAELVGAGEGGVCLVGFAVLVLGGFRDGLFVTLGVMDGWMGKGGKEG